MMDEAVNLSQFLQACIAPVALVSGVGLILLSATNRFARTIDRTRVVAEELETGNLSAEKKAERKAALQVLFRRSKHQRNCIALIIVSVIFSSLIIPVLFFMDLFEINLRIFGYLLFVFAIVSLLTALVFFLLDVSKALHALEMDVERHQGK